MPCNRISHSAGTGLAFLVLALSATAQTPPDAGSLMKQIEKGLPAPIPQPQRPAVVLEPEMKPPTGLVVTVRRFRFVGNIHVDEARLQAAVAAWLNRPIDFVELQ